MPGGVSFALKEERMYVAEFTGLSLAIPGHLYGILSTTDSGIADHNS